MQGAVPTGVGAMAAIIGLDDAGVIAACDEASSIGIAEPVNFNSPGQVVIAGHKEAVDNAIAHCKAAGARLAMPLPVSVPSHSSLMIGAGEALREALAAVEFRAPAIRVVAATDGKAYTDGDDIRARLSQQVYSPVHWVTTVNAMIDGGTTAFVECGPGKVLAGLSRRINKSVPVHALDTTESLQKALTA
jgi:[acyl-carrier-protein] S-malonyltransferase